MPSNTPPETHPSLIPIGQAIFAARKRRRWSRMRLAVEAEVDYRTAIHAEQGHKLNLSSLIPILEVLGLELNVRHRP